MSRVFMHALQAEWLKKKRSLAAWLVVVASLFTPVIVTIARLFNHARLGAIYASGSFWDQLWKSSWESMAIFFLPMAAILFTSLVAQIEFRNNAWKQVHTLPLGFMTIFASKLAVVVLMTVQLFVLFNIAVWMSAVVPYLLVGGVHYPQVPISWTAWLADDLRYFVDCLPIIALQYAISLRFGNFLVPVGVGFVAWVGALAALSWKFGCVIPYTYCMLDYLKDDHGRKAAVPLVDIHWLAIGYFLLFSVLGYRLFVGRAQKG